MRVSLIGQTVLVLTLTPAPIFACKCVAPPPDAPHGRLLWDARRKADVVFEGKVESAEPKWRPIDAQAGEVIPADIEEGEAAVQVTFEVLRNYSEVNQKHLKLKTGFGGGDCGFPFEVGEKYLVDGYKDDSGDISTGICSQTALLEDSQQEVAYLRGDPEIPETAARNLPPRAGQICGHLVLDNAIRPTDGEVLLFREGSTSLVPSEGAEPTADSSFCIKDIRPGRYLMAFTSPERSPTSFVLFPGVPKWPEAKAIEISAGQEITHLLFTVPRQRTYVVSGKLSNFNKTQRQAEPKVLLLGADRLLLLPSYDQEVAADGSFTFPQVLPGKYWAIVDVESNTDTKWSTRKVEVEVDGDVQGLTLELTAN